MMYSIQNDQIKVTVSGLGAELQSVAFQGREYLWQADPTYWDGRAPILFPICGRLFEGKYTYQNKTYAMEIHGFARQTEFELVSHTETALTLKIESNAQTKQIYPFDFCLFVTYTLQDNTLKTSAKIVNTGKQMLPAAFGGHPAFYAPLGSGTFEDCYLEFGQACHPERILITESGLNSGKTVPLALEDAKILRLSHALFDHDGIFMKGQADCVTLRSTADSRSVTLRYSGMPYLGIWQPSRCDAPFICIEPWCGLPAFEGKTDDFSEKNDMFHVAIGEEKTVAFDMIFC